MIKLEVIGCLGADAVIVNKDGNDFISFRVAHNHSTTTTEGLKKEYTVWVSCSMDIKRRNVVQYLLKGTRVFVDGFCTPKVGQNEDGSPKAFLSLRVDNLEFCSSLKKD